MLRPAAIVLCLLAGAVPGAGVAAGDAPEEPGQWQDARDDAARAFQSVGGLSAADRDAAMATIDETLTRLDRQVDRIENRVRDGWSLMSRADRDRAAGALREMRERRNRLSRSLGALSAGSAPAWSDLMQDVQDDWTELDRAWGEAVTASGPAGQEDGK